ncbi:hypothetical protein [Mycobacterium avium]|uniref:hypothetical protein n=1 Tax=Mycobacterium avium TaxID=1764 RepID=UPI0011552A57|nr:hypothetical protein [Mycobacterium avium]
MPNDPGGVVVRVALLDAFHYGDDAVLVAMNPAGLDTLTSALHEALTRQVSRRNFGGRAHTLQCHAGSNDIYLRDNHDDQVLWRLNPTTMGEMIVKLDGMKGHGLCHNYVDITTPASTLVLSVDEYLVPNAVVHTSPFGYF